MTAEKIARIRAAMPVTEKTAYLNTGTSGPLSKYTVDTLTGENTRELAEGRAGIAGFMRLTEAKTALRQAFADLTGASPAEIALTHHTTEGMNIVSHGLNLQPGDEVVTPRWSMRAGCCRCTCSNNGAASRFPPWI